MCKTLEPKKFEDWAAEDFLEAYDGGYEFSEEEIKRLVWGDNGFSKEVDQEEGESGRWHQYMTTIIEIKARYFAVYWSAGLTEYQEHIYDGPVQEVKPVKKMVEITEWVAVEKK